MNDQIKKMAELLKSGATMLPDACPVCNSPLFKVENRILCAKCGYSPASGTKAAGRSDDEVNTLAKMNLLAIKKIGELEGVISKTMDLGKLKQLAELTLAFLRILSLLHEIGEKSPRGE
jgi:UPF0148 protein